MKHTEAEILDALKVIKEVCEDIDSGCCNRCPFFLDGPGCMLGEDTPPVAWRLNDITWRAFI
jgi:hypothetical protein